MTSMSTSATGAPTLHSPAAVFSSVVKAAVGIAAAKLEQKVVAWTDKLNGVGQGEHVSEGLTPLADEALDELGELGTPEKAGAEGVKALLHGKNPVWAAIKGTWQSASPVLRAAMITAVVFAVVLVLLSPVLLIVFLLSLLIVSAVHRTHKAKT